MSQFTLRLRARLPAALELSDSQLALLENHFSLLVSWNKRLNLTRITDVQGAIERHYMESLFLANLLPKHPFSLIDAGSGAGFPGIPVAVALPWASVSLAESDARKAVFLKEAACKLPNVEVEAKRISGLSSCWDWLASRAVKWRDLMPWASTHVQRVALLTTATEAESIRRKYCLPLSVHRLGSAGDRVVAIGYVPRGT